MSNITVKQDSPIAKLKRTLSQESVQVQFRNALKKGSDLFVASLIDLYANDKYLQQCDPNAVIMEALKAATLKLPINKSLGFAYIVPYKNNKQQSYIPTMIIGYKGYLQLAQRTAQYRYINADCVFEGEKIEQDRLTGEIIISGEPISETAIGYFAHIETINGFRKTIFWSKEKVINHAKRYSQSYASDYSPWKKQFDTMAIKTVIRFLLGRYGIMSVDMANAVDIDSGDDKEQEVEITQRPAISYEATAKPPQEQPKVVNLNRQPAPPAAPAAPPEPPREQPDPPTQDQQGAKRDEFGMPVEHPLAKDNWFKLRSGNPADGTGFGAYLKAHVELFADLTEPAYETMATKYRKIYGRDITELTEAIEDDQSASEVEIQPGHPDLAKPPEQPAMSQQQVLESDAANQLYSLGKKYPAKYKQVVANQIPTSIEQIFGWMDEINQLVIDESRGATDNDNEGKW